MGANYDSAGIFGDPNSSSSNLLDVTKSCLNGK